MPNLRHAPNQWLISLGLHLSLRKPIARQPGAREPNHCEAEHGLPEPSCEAEPIAC